MFEHAMSKTQRTAPARIQSARRICNPAMCSNNGTTRTPRPASVAGSWRASLPEIMLISALACSIDTPGLRRPSAQKARQFGIAGITATAHPQ